jgi:2,4-dienoyl-CoA reductase-like NADH-dependent reductase (Old Yellow Enzyme family)/thioredoxin reductase
MNRFFMYPNKYPHVFSPLKVGPITLKNRIYFSPLVCNMVTANGEVTREYVDWVDMQARTGAAVVTLGATPVDLSCAADAPCELDITSDDKECGLMLLSEAAHIHGAKLSVELLHAGRAADPMLLKRPEALSASPMPVFGRPRLVKEMDRNDIDHAVRCFADCAKRLQRCGFDMVLIHAGHSNLLAQFLSPATNKRTDWYGGSFENRARFPLQVLKAVREAVGPGMAIDMRISGDEYVPGGMMIDEVIEFIKLAQEYIDIVHVSAGWIADCRSQFYTMPPYYRPKGCNVPLARAVKQCPDVRIPVITVGGIQTLEMAEKIVSEGSADVVAMARALLADPELVVKSYTGHPEDVRPCLRCWDCNVPGHIRCAVNPALGRAGAYAKPVAAPRKKKAVVVGGGPAGMTAARTLRERGHDVVLFEKSDRLGGMLREIAALQFKEELRDYTAWAVRTTMACGADVRLNTAATPELVRAENPDVVFIAAGGKMAAPSVPGIDKPLVKGVLDVDNRRCSVGDSVVVCGGGVSGLECALSLALDGKKVTVVDQLETDDFAKGMASITRTMLMTLLEDNGVTLLGGRRVIEFRDDGVVVQDRDWQYAFLPSDTAVAAFGVVQGLEPVRELCAIVPETYVVGDCASPGKLFDANNGAYCLAVLV